jgi:hypothetical protein
MVGIGRNARRGRRRGRKAWGPWCVGIRGPRLVEALDRFWQWFVLGESGQYGAKVNDIEGPGGGNVVKSLGGRRWEAGDGLNAAALSEGNGEESI